LLAGAASVATGCERKLQAAPAQKPPEVKLLDACRSRFAIAEATGDTCKLQPNTPNGWEIVPQIVTQGRDQKNATPVPVEKPWTVFPESKDRKKEDQVAFCVYQWTGPKLPTKDDFDPLHASPECAIATPMGDQPELLKHALPPLAKAFDRQARGIEGSATVSWPAAMARADRAPDIAVVDSTPFELTRRDTFGHGFTVSRVIASLACVDPDSADCARRIRPHMALPLVQASLDKWVYNQNGGYFGNFHDLFRAFVAALEERDPKRNLIINLSLGWDPIKTDPGKNETKIMHGLLERAYCEGALVVAAAGNLTGTEGPLLPAAMEVTPPPTKERCFALGIKGPPKPKDTFHSKLRNKPYQPLVHAVAAVDINDQRLMVVRPWGDSRLSAYGMDVGTETKNPPGYTDLLTGTSGATAIISGIAGAIWRVRPDLSASDVMEIIYESGRLLDGKSGSVRSRTEFCLDTNRDGCEEWPVRRASLCSALNAASPAFKLRCVNYSKDKAPAAYYPPPPTDRPPLPTSPPPPCRVANCGNPVSAMSNQLPMGAFPQPGLPSCSACTLVTRFTPQSGAVFGTGTPPPPSVAPHFTVLVRTWDQFWTPQDWAVFPGDSPNGAFFQWFLPPATTQYAVMNWYYSVGGFNAMDSTALIVQ
jgi:hypothetical protein